MNELLDKLFSNPQFPMFLGIIIAVLLVLFCVVFILGKKDQKKIEETMRLEAIKDNAFAEVTTPVAPEIAVPIVDEPLVNNEEIENTINEPQEVYIAPPIISDEQAFNIDVTPSETEESFIEKETIPEHPIFNDEVATPTLNSEEIINEDLSYEDALNISVPDYSHLTQTIDNELSVMEHKSYSSSIEDKLKELETLEASQIEPVKLNETKPLQDTSFNTDEEPVKKPQVMNVFSSVYVPPVKNDEFIDTFEDDEPLELPKLK